MVGIKNSNVLNRLYIFIYRNPTAHSNMNKTIVVIKPQGVDTILCEINNNSMGLPKGLNLIKIITRRYQQKLNQGGIMNKLFVYI